MNTKSIAGRKKGVTGVTGARAAALALLGLTVAVLAITSCTSREPVAPTQPSPEARGLRADAPTYALHGPFWVGYEHMTIGEGDEQLEVDVWYPALNLAGAEEEITYQFSLQQMLLRFPGWPSDVVPVVHGHALKDAAPDETEAPYPLVVFSHGFGLNPAWYNTLLEHYASYGFVVLAPQHTDPDWSESWEAAIDRPRDIERLLDYAEDLGAPTGEMAELIDMERIAVVGHSFGGYTALAVGGAQYDLEAFERHYADLAAAEDPNAWILMPFSGKAADLAARANLDSVPEGLWPSFRDSRVDAIVPISSDAFLFDEAGLAGITIPVMAMGGTADTGAPYEWGTRPSYDYAASKEKSLVGFEGAEHMFITTTCESMPWIEGTPFYEMTCSDPAWEKERALDLVHHLSSAFLLDMLEDDLDAHRVLLPSEVSFDGVIYETTLD
jgi:predicted dienelactone hydrolase